jgi:ABC-type multidrug transport system ATPase subunit
MSPPGRPEGEYRRAQHEGTPASRPHPDAVLQLDDVGFAYDGQTPLASHWSAAIGAGVTLLHGDTGCGKSSLLRVIAGRLPASGRLTLAGVRLDADPDAYRRHVFFCESTNAAFDQVSARAATTALRADDAQFSESRWRDLVEGFALTPHLDKPLYMLSTGSKRKVWLAAALASGRPLILLDEPSGALDAASIRTLGGALDAMARQPQQAVIVASSDRLERVAFASTIALPPS